MSTGLSSDHNSLHSESTDQRVTQAPPTTLETGPSTENLQDAILNHCESNEALRKQLRRTRRRLRAGLALIAFGYLAILTGLPDFLVLAVGLSGTWLFCTSLGNDELLAELEDEVDLTRQTLDTLMDLADDEHRSAAMEACIKIDTNRRWLTDYLPGPIEINRRAA